MTKAQGQNETETLIQLASDLDGETDRALGIVASAHLEYLLQRFLSLTLKVPTLEAGKFLFESPNAPLGSLSAKIEFARLFQLLSGDETYDLNLIRKIRNEFAHKLIGTSFGTQSIKNRCAELKNARIGGDPGTARERFKKAAIRLIVEITLKIKTAEKS